MAALRIGQDSVLTCLPVQRMALLQPGFPPYSFFCDGCVRPLGVPESTLFLDSMFVYSFIKHVLALFLLPHAMVSLREIKVHNKKSLVLSEVT